MQCLIFIVNRILFSSLMFAAQNCKFSHMFLLNDYSYGINAFFDVKQILHFTRQRITIQKRNLHYSNTW